MLRGIRLSIFALVLCAASPVAAQSAFPEIMNLDEAAAFLGINRVELGQLADWRQVPASRIGSQWRFSCRALLTWLANSYFKPPPTSPAVVYGCQGTAVTPVAPAAPPAPAITGTIPARAPGAVPGPTPIGEAPEGETADDVFLRDQRLLLGSGDVTLELGLFYVRSDDQAFVAVTGGTALGVVEKDSFISTFTARYGLFPDTELFASSLFRRDSSQTFVGNVETSNTSGTDFGDVTLGLRETVLHEGLGVPDVILTFQSDIPTGDNAFTLGGGIALVKSYDPVVLFANGNYSHTFAEESFPEVEDRLDTTLGFAFALNDTLTLSSTLTGVFTGESSFTSGTLRRTESFSLQFGLTTLLDSGFYIEPTVSFSLNGDGNDVVLGLSMPYTFQP